MEKIKKLISGGGTSIRHQRVHCDKKYFMRTVHESKTKIESNATIIATDGIGAILQFKLCLSGQASKGSIATEYFLLRYGRRTNDDWIFIYRCFDDLQRGQFFNKRSIYQGHMSQKYYGTGI